MSGRVSVLVGVGFAITVQPWRNPLRFIFAILFRTVTSSMLSFLATALKDLLISDVAKAVRSWTSSRKILVSKVSNSINLGSEMDNLDLRLSCSIPSNKGMIKFV